MVKTEVVMVGLIKMFCKKKLMKKEKLNLLLSEFDIKLSINVGVLKAQINFTNNDKKAAWELYVELLTRITTQPLPDKDGVEQTALDSIYSIFSLTREVLKKYGSQTIQFSKIAIPVLNQKIRPFTAKWHKLSHKNAFKEPEKCKEFRGELKNLQVELQKYNQLLAHIAGVEDLTKLEDTKQ